MRVTANTGYESILSDLQHAAGELAKWQRQVSSGKRLHVPSDDPARAAVGVNERAELATLDSYVAAADSVNSRLSVVDTVYSDMVSLITEAKTTAAGGRTTVLSASERDTLARKLEGLRTALVADYNTQFRGVFLFSGTAGNRAPYVQQADGSVSTYQGNADRSAVDVNRGQSVEVTFDGESIARGADANDSFTVLGKLIDAVRSGDMAGVDAGITGLDRAFDRTVLAQSAVGTRMAALESQKAQLQSLQIGSKSRISKAEDANMAEAISNLTQAQTAQQAALAAAATRARLSLMDYLK